ncbi:hypothetical protein [Streptomyces sp. V1I1]|uniref:hypothetical protein n=1 Tax=Streptomyces sp. V1I1 TaxID=3042272 RepID=UPI002785AEE7|nr:hypothetical protein [Streptomyces sp. V1I1]MDQ0943006.1 hypothetical protein [Streptomyces sp. V1I1]
MKFVRVAPLEDQYGYSLDPQAYLGELPGLKGALPSGAYAFASHAGHYDFGSTRCVKDLTMAEASLVDEGEELSLTIRLNPNDWKHESGLRIRYTDVRDVRVAVDEGDGTIPRLGSLLLDELLPHPDGFTHEIAFTSGSLFVVAADLVATWEEGDPS